MPNDPRHSRFVTVKDHTGTLVIDTHVDQPETMQSPTRRKNGRKMITMRVEQNLDGEDIATALLCWHSLDDGTKKEFEKWLRQEIEMEGYGYFMDIEFWDVDHPCEDDRVVEKMRKWFPEFDIWKEYYTE